MCDELSALVLDDEVEQMDTSDTPWYWYYKAKCGVWHRVEDDPRGFMSSDDLERYYLRNPQGVINMTTASGQFQINFAASLQVNLKTGKEKQIKRSFQFDSGFRCKCDEISPSPPAHWEDVDPKKPFQLISLRKGSSEYQMVERFFRDEGLLDKPIISIKRIQNMDLWELFCRLPDKKRRKHILGKGTYFAKHAAFANSYSNTRQGTKVMLFARVIVGKYTTGHQDYCTPNDDQHENIYDSCVDNSLYPRIFVIFDSNQIYPEYVLEYRSN